MQKKLLALAIAGAMAAPLAAQAQGSNVTIYGLMQPSVDFIDSGSESGASMQTNNSRIGFKGSEDLGNGLKAIFQIESAIDFDERGAQDVDVVDEVADGAWARRDSWLGLSGSFGSVVFGNMFPAYKNSTNFADVMGDSIGDYNNVVAAAFDGADEFNSRFTNAAHYTSPKFGGFQVQATYGLRGDEDGDGFEDDSGDDDNDSFSVAGTYAWGPMNFAVAYEDQGEGDDDADGNAQDRKAFKIGAGYKFGSTSLVALWANEEFSATNDVNGEFYDERDVWMLGVKHAMGKITLAATYTYADDFDSLDDSGADSWAVGATYAFSKRTNIGAYYASVDNDDNADYGLDAGYRGTDNDAAGDPVAATGEKIHGFSVRLSHKF